MERIAFIAPFEEILTLGQKVIKELGLENRVSCYIGMHSEGLEIAYQAEKNGIGVIVSRGGTAELIENSNIQIPVVEIPFTFEDLAEALINAKKLTGRKNPRIAIMAYKNMMHSIEVFARIMEIQLGIYQINSEKEIPNTVKRAVKDKPDIVIGGKGTTDLANELGVKTVLLKSGNDSFRIAFEQAVKLSDVRRHEMERMKKFRVIVDNSTQGIISIDSEKRINVFNQAAERLLGYNLDQVTGKEIEMICSTLPVDDCLKEARELRGQLIKINNKKLVVNIIPIIIGETVTGAMITLEDVGQIVEMEATIRKGIYSRGLTAQYNLNDIRGNSPQIKETKRIAQEYAGVDATVLILGSSGTGKELFAQGIHNTSKRKQRPFVAVNCGAIPSSLLESELFGYVEGAFTGANKKGKAGFFELAHGGTIFLDEIGEMDKVAQTSLLRVIQERRIMRLGDDKYLPIDVRIITATNKNLFDLVEKEKFREDLYYRLNVLPLELPPLKERIGDALYLAEYYIGVYNQMFGRDVRLSKLAKDFIDCFPWPGNVRQLRNAMERLVLIAKESEISIDLIESILGHRIEKKPILDIVNTEDDSPEKKRILEVLEETEYNQKEAAKKLGIDRTTLYRKLKALDIKLKKAYIR